MGRAFKSIDIYGRSVQLTYKGEDSYKTCLGAFVTYIVLGLLLSFSGFGLYRMFERINPDVSLKTFVRDLNLEGPYKPEDQGFDIAFGI